MNENKVRFWVGVKRRIREEERKSLRTLRGFWAVIFFVAACTAMTLMIHEGSSIEPVPCHEPTGATP